MKQAGRFGRKELRLLVVGGELLSSEDVVALMCVKYFVAVGCVLERCG